ncbi:hypothetical protein GCM10010234_48930 [Streptomyces hawaiiensis]
MWSLSRGRRQCSWQIGIGLEIVRRAPAPAEIHGAFPDTGHEGHERNEIYAGED